MLSSLGADFDEFVQRSSTELLRIAILLTNDRGHAEDLVQTTFLRTGWHWRTARSNPRRYARKVLSNLARNRWREQARRPKERFDHTGVEAAHASAEDAIVQRDHLYQLVARLPLDQRKVLVLRYFEDLPVDEVADILGCSPGTVKSRASRAFETLRRSMNETTPTAHQEGKTCAHR
jgi:RNA polymerase sigma-70 factor (sigma-E family)